MLAGDKCGFPLHHASFGVDPRWLWPWEQIVRGLGTDECPKAASRVRIISWSRAGARSCARACWSRTGDVTRWPAVPTPTPPCTPSAAARWKGARLNVCAPLTLLMPASLWRWLRCELAGRVWIPGCDNGGKCGEQCAAIFHTLAYRRCGTLQQGDCIFGTFNRTLQLSCFFVATLVNEDSSRLLISLGCLDMHLEEIYRILLSVHCNQRIN